MNKLIFENYLLVLKSTVEVFVHGTLEASNKEVKDLLKSSLNCILNMQEATYNEMTKEGWYITNNVNTNAISKTIEKINKQ
ncbi:MAG: spore coat protein [Bacilli bacterium]|nr:spore coat protein [Bacilli bacterium]